MRTETTYGHLKFTGKEWILSQLEPHVAIRLKQLFPRVPKTETREFRIQHSPTLAADLEWFLSRYPLEVEPSHRAHLQKGAQLFYDQRAEMERILLPTYTPNRYAGLRKGQEVRTYQAQAVEILRRSNGLLLGDEVGLGKTYMAAAAALMPDARPTAIVCQPHLQSQWVEVLRDFTTLRVHPVKATAPYLFPQSDVVVFRYTQLAGWIDTFRELEFQLVVWDEIQELRRGTESQKGQASKILANHAKYRLGLSATPIYNYGAEIWEIMQFLRPEVLGERHEFLREWCTGHYDDAKRVTNPKALGSYLREQHAFLRRSKADVGRELPKVNKIVETIDYDSKTVRSIDDLAHQLAIKASTGSFVERGQATRELDIMVRQQTGIAKAVDTARFARMVVESGESILLFGWHREVYEIWLRELESLKPAMYTGSETASQKEKEKQRFLSGDTDILIQSLRSSAGLDGLQHRCSTAIFGELDWSPGVHHQCIGRLDREGQTLPVTAIFLVVDEGSDPPMMEVLGLKASQASDILDPSLGVQAVHSDRTAMHKLVEKYLKTRKH